MADRIAILREGRLVQVDTPARVVLNPADDYVAEFTRDVPRAKVVTAGSIAERTGARLDTSDAVGVHTTVEELLPRFAGRSTPLAVLDEDGRVTGQLTGDNVLRALAAGG